MYNTRFAYINLVLSSSIGLWILYGVISTSQSSPFDIDGLWTLYKVDSTLLSSAFGMDSHEYLGHMGTVIPHIVWGSLHLFLLQLWGWGLDFRAHRRSVIRMPRDMPVHAIMMCYHAMLEDSLWLCFVLMLYFTMFHVTLQWIVLMSIACSIDHRLIRMRDSCFVYT